MTRIDHARRVESARARRGPRWAWAASFALVLGAGACTDGPRHTLDHGRELAARGDHAGAIAVYDRVLAGLDAATEPERYEEALFAKVASLVLSDPIASAVEFLALAEEHASAVEPTDFACVFDLLAATESFESGDDASLDAGDKVLRALEAAHPDRTRECAAMRERLVDAVVAREIDAKELELLRHM